MPNAMATYRHGHEENPKCVIRDQLALDPVTTIPRLTEAISRRLNHSFDLRYIKRLWEKVVARTLIESIAAKSKSG